MAVTAEERLTARQEEVAGLKAQMHQLLNSNANWLERVSGSMKGVPGPVFEKFKEYCAEIRQADRPVDEET